MPSSKPRIRKIGLVIKHRQPEAASLAERVGNYIYNRGLTCYFEKESAKVVRLLKKAHKGKATESKFKLVSRAEIAKTCDLIVVLGGDGTYLSVARLMEKRVVPIVGINMGQLGFLTEIKKTETFEVLSQILDGKRISISERTLLDVSHIRNKKTIYEGPAVNDAVISMGAIARIVGIEIYVDRQYLTTVRADGLIISSPTGSTAYSLAAGGPILEPSVPAFVITPICAHSLTQRPIVVPDSMLIEAKVADFAGTLHLTLDGQRVLDMKTGDAIRVKRFSKHRLKTVTSPTRDYFSLLREKFKFGMRA